jgi:hypothetical protein
MHIVRYKVMHTMTYFKTFVHVKIQRIKHKSLLSNVCNKRSYISNSHRFLFYFKNLDENFGYSLNSFLFHFLQCATQRNKRHESMRAKGTHCKDKIPKFQNKYSLKRNCAASDPISIFMCL